MSNNGIAAIHWFDGDNIRIRVYFQMDDNDVYELSWDGPDGKWYRGNDGNGICSARPNTSLAATVGPNSSGALVIHLFYIGTDHTVKNYLQTNGGIWSLGYSIESESVHSNSGLAANMQGHIREKGTSDGPYKVWRWGGEFDDVKPGSQFAVLNSMPETEKVDTFLHLFFYNADNAIVHSTSDGGGSWEFSEEIVPASQAMNGGGLAAVSWHAITSYYEMRVYFPDSSGKVVELNYHSKSGWLDHATPPRHTMDSNTSPLTAHAYRISDGKSNSLQAAFIWRCI
ncbi:hypothetical protein BT96DRAFT_1015309 [Gymnopus androsaceus JB14]|uniref:Uncharacterized protein n=1 Tax=Gymnopus androsaceus JB14 TaxID=1447944 RepID=A0A6A4I5G9_9AGAR|nr:hypothetical protein BT96DRAFT_1015309 [Gymnopus androsaceus JB14]